MCLVYPSTDALVALRTCRTARPTVGPDGLVSWHQKRAHRLLSATGIQKKMERYAKAAGMTVSCHRLRHPFASNLLDAGAEGISSKEWLGHASVTSRERYATLSNQRVKQVSQQTMRKVIAKTRV
jgi:site-specific recombinase XerD